MGTVGSSGMGSNRMNGQEGQMPLFNGDINASVCGTRSTCGQRSRRIRVVKMP